jgi:hypothetical protein
MDLSLTKQQAFEIAAFLRVPAKKFPSPTEARKALHVREAFEKSIKEYAQVFETIAKEQGDIVQTSQVQYQSFCRTAVKVGEKDMLPTPEEQQAKAVSMQEEVNKTLESLKNKAEDYKNNEGEVMIAVTVDPNEWDYFRIYFAKESTQFPMWQELTALDKIATLVESA